MFVVLEMREFLNAIGHGHRQQAEMADQFVEPAVLLAGSGDHPVHRFMRWQEAGHHVDAGNREGNPQRQYAQKNQRPERQPDQQIAQAPDRDFPRETIGIFAGDQPFLFA